MKERAMRLRVAFGELVKRNLVSKQKEIAEKMGASPSNVSSAFNGDHRVLTDKFIIRFNAAFDNIFNLNWLLAGEGEMLKSQYSSAELVGDVYSVATGDDGVLKIDFVPVTAHASFIESLGDGNFEFEKYPVLRYTLPDSENLDKYKIFEVHGDSMSPGINDGAKILTQEIPPSRWHYAEGVVVAVFSDYVVVKRIDSNQILNDNLLVLASDNPKYGKMTIPLCDIRALFKAIKIISSDIV